MSDPLKELVVTRAGKSVNPQILFWQKELENSQKREKKFRKDAERVVKIYEGDRREENSFNVLFSNTETLLPACYNQRPRPFVDRKFKDEDPLGKLAAKVLERTLAALEDSGDQEYTPFSDLMEQATLGALVPGRGVTWFRYDSIIESTPKETELPEDADLTAETAKTEVDGEDILPTVDEKVVYETICGEDLDYNEFLFGPGRTWSKVPWVARYHEMTEADATASFGAELAGKLNYTKPGKESPNGWKTKSNDEEDPQGSENITVVWEIWNREKKEVLFYAPCYQDEMLKTLDDPLQLSGFYPCPQPLQFLLKRSKLVPTPLYLLYEEQAKELNRITTRINKVLGAMKIRGFYDGTMQGLKGLLEADDNTLLPATNVAALQAGQNLQNSIWFMPLEVLVSTLQTLWQGREEIKDTIYEITGMADIMRGEGAASAPATLQNIKNQWGTLRLKRWQRYVQEYVRDSLRIMGELAGKHFSVETFAQMTDLDFALPQEIQQAQQTVNAIQQQMFQMQQVAQQQAAMQQSMAPPPGAAGPGSPLGVNPPSGDPSAPPGGPPPSPAQPLQPPQLPPQMQQAMEEAQAVLAKPAWEEVIQFLRNDLQRYYRIDIETNSTIADNTAEDKQNMTDALGAIAQVMQGFTPMVEQGVLTLPVVRSILLSVVRRFSFGREVEDQLEQIPDQLPQPQQNGPSPAEQQATEAEAQAKLQQAQIDMQVMQRREEADQQEHQFKMAQMQRDEEMAQQKHQLDMTNLSMQAQGIVLKGQLAQSDAQVELAKENAEMDAAHRGMAVDAVTSAATVKKAVLGAETARRQVQAAKNKPKGNPAN